MSATAPAVSTAGTAVDDGPVAAPVVVMVEDVFADAELVAAQLRLGFPCTVRRAGTLAEAVVEISRPDVDLVLTDLGLPDADGLDGLRRMLAVAHDVPVVVLTGSASTELGPEAVRLGAQDYLPKHGLAPEMLARSARYAIERNRHQRELQRTRASLERSLARFSRLVARAPIGMALVDSEGLIHSANLALAGVVGTAPGELEGRPITSLVAAEHRPFLLAALADPGSRTPEVRLVGHEPRWFALAVADVTAGTTVELAVQFSDITDRRQAEHALQHAALHDALTGLPNRTLFLDRLAHAHQRIGRDTDAVGVVFLDLDDFKAVNDEYGHRTGDAFLVEFAQRLMRATRTTDTAARYAGDEFVVVLEHLRHPDDAHDVADRIAAAVAGDIGVGPLTLPLRFSVGVAVTSDPGVDIDDLVHSADEAMYQAKQTGCTAVVPVVTPDPT
ncbi:MAG TPA: diguanylate cyclase [Acidimicrobiales bacterium]|nr:diguanylate cyclase [Acidimicrobiales bacterium]